MSHSRTVFWKGQSKNKFMSLVFELFISTSNKNIHLQICACHFTVYHICSRNDAFVVKEK